MGSKTFVAGATCLIAVIGMVGSAGAQGVRLGGSITQTFDITDNNNLSGGGVDIGSTTAFGLTLSSATPNSRIAASTGAALSFGTNNSLAISQPRLNLDFATNTRDLSVTGALSFVQRPAAVDITQPDLSILRYTGDETRISGSLGLSHQVNARSSLSLGLGADIVTYDPASAGLFDNNTFRITGDFQQTVSPQTSYGVTLGLGLFEADNASDTTSVSADLTGTLTHQLDQLTSVNGSLGLSYVETTDTVLGVESLTTALSALYSVGVSRQLPDGSMGLSLNQSVVPSASGSLVIDTTLTGDLNRTVNNNVGYGISATLGRQERIGGGTSTSYVNIAPSYSRQLTRDVSANASYVFQRDNTGAVSQSVVVSFSRNFDFPL